MPLQAMCSIAAEAVPVVCPVKTRLVCRAGGEGKFITHITLQGHQMTASDLSLSNLSANHGVKMITGF